MQIQIQIQKYKFRPPAEEPATTYNGPFIGQVTSLLPLLHPVTRCLYFMHQKFQKLHSVFVSNTFPKCRNVLCSKLARKCILSSASCEMYGVYFKVQFELHHDRFVSLTGFRTHTSPPMTNVSLIELHSFRFVNFCISSRSILFT